MTRWRVVELVVVSCLVVALAVTVVWLHLRPAPEPEIRYIEVEPSGGAEADIPEPPVVETWLRFPIAPEDYLMLTSAYGVRVSPILHIERYHQGIDVAATWQAQVVASADGTVVEHWPPPGTPHPGGGAFRGHDVYGGLVVLEHEDGWQTLYAHLSWTRVKTGQQIRAGEVIGRVGATGMARGNHLHYEVINPDGQPVNPLLYVEVER